MSEETKQKVAVVTGCSSGIGFETALELARNNYKVYATMRNLSKKTEIKEVSDSENLQIECIGLDVKDDNSVKNAVLTILENEGHIDVLINNAGYGIIGSIEDTSIEETKEIFDTIYFGAVRMIQNILPVMKKQSSGQIINIGSLAGKIGFGFFSSYVSTKFALDGLTQSLRQELQGTGIDVSIIEPGAVTTNFHKNMKTANNAINTPEKKEFIDLLKKQTEKIFTIAFEPKHIAQKIIKVLNEKNTLPCYSVGRDAERLMIDKKRLSPLDFEKAVNKFFEDIMNI
jgi:short-subunit dehydrogenase